MASIRTLFDALIEEAGNKLTVEVANERQYETLRTRLVKMWTDHKTALIAIGGEDSDPTLRLSLCSNYDKNTDNATFFLGIPRRKQALQFSFSIVKAETASSSPLESGDDNGDSSPDQDYNIAK